MQAEFTRYIKRWKVDRSIGIEILHKMISRELAKNFSMHGNRWVVGERQAFKLTRTYRAILNALTCCDDSVSGQKVRSSIEAFLRNKAYYPTSPTSIGDLDGGSTRRKDKDED